jgi:hypothetical protein
VSGQTEDAEERSCREPTTDDRRPTTDDRRPTTDDRRPTTDDREPTCGKTKMRSRPATRTAFAA